MDWSSWPGVVGAAVGGPVLVWLVLVVVLWRTRPDDVQLREVLRLLPDVVRLVRRLATDSSLPRSLRLPLWLLLGYLVLPVDLVPDFLPVIGWADDAVVVALVLRSVVRRVGPEVMCHHWPGSADGLSALHRLVGLPPS